MKKIAVAAALLGVILSAGNRAFTAGEAAPKFSLPDIDGKTVNVGGLIGKKTVVLNFWAAWCTSCVEEIPQLKALQESPGADKAVFFGINAGENERKAKRFVEKNQFPYKVLIDRDKSIARKYGVPGIPVTVIIAKDGTIIYRGSRPPKDYSFK